jgi:hypothetical protein
MIPSVISVLSNDNRRLHEDVVAPKFNAYFSFTKDLIRSIPLGVGVYIYADNSLNSDLNFLWLIFTDVHEIVGKPEMADLVKREPFFQQQFFQIVEGDLNNPNGEFWHQVKPGTLSRISTHDAVNRHLESLFRTLRNGFAHAHWLYEDLSASDYWNFNFLFRLRQLRNNCGNFIEYLVPALHLTAIFPALHGFISNEGDFRLAVPEILKEGHVVRTVYSLMFYS